MKKVRIAAAIIFLTSFDGIVLERRSSINCMLNGVKSTGLNSDNTMLSNSPHFTPSSYLLHHKRSLLRNEGTKMHRELSIFDEVTSI